MRDSGEFIVIVAAVYMWKPLARAKELSCSVHTDMASHDGLPTSFEAASCSILRYTERMPLGAATVPGLANEALIAAFSAGESFDMSSTLLDRLKAPSISL